MEFIGFVLVLAILVILVATNIRVVPQANAYVVERLGAYQATWGVGLHVKIPLIDKVARRISLKEQVVDFPPQPVITKDNVTMQIDTVIFFQITDPKFYTYGVDRPMSAIENLSATTLRSREIINTRMRIVLDEATDPWGIKINRVEVKNIIPPKEIQNAMEKQMKAEREKRESILIAEGQKNAAILVSQGKKESLILEAEAEKQAAILRAEAKKEASIREAEGQAEAILSIQKATAEGLKMIKEVQVDKEVLTLKSFEAFEKAANGQATKIIVPSEIQSLAGLASALTEISSK